MGHKLNNGPGCRIGLPMTHVALPMFFAYAAPPRHCRLFFLKWGAPRPGPGGVCLRMLTPRPGPGGIRPGVLCKLQEHLISVTFCANAEHRFSPDRSLYHFFRVWSNVSEPQGAHMRNTSGFPDQIQSKITSHGASEFVWD